ncbi:MAG: NYN domain-containing protein [Pirellulaceae bacterium]|nr:NYN domain-containing protein [Pirellulaceae bacterium]
MALLIDGYNLLHAAGVFAADGPPTLERSRQALLDHLARLLEPKVRARTIVVFDAVHAPPGLAREATHEGLSVRFARRGGTADELLEELIAAEPDPRHLLVVSSDHRVQRAARQRGAQYLDSEHWHAQVSRARSAENQPATADDAKAELPLGNPFPPGYGDDLLQANRREQLDPPRRLRQT